MRLSQRRCLEPEACLRIFLRANKLQNCASVCVLQRVEHGEEVDGEPGSVKGAAEVHAGEEERVGRAGAAVGGVRDFGGREFCLHGVLETCEFFPSNLEGDVPDAQAGEAERGVVGVAEDLLEVPGARARGKAGVVVLCAWLCFYAEVVDDSVDAAVQNAELVEHGEHGEAVRGGVRVDAAGEGERENKFAFAVLAEELEHGAGGGMLLEDTADSAGPCCVHGLEAAEAAQVGRGEEGRLRE